MMRGRERDPERTGSIVCPFSSSCTILKPSRCTNARPDRNDNRLIGRDLAQGSAIEMIEVRVCHEHEIDRRQVMNMKAGSLIRLITLSHIDQIGID